MSTFTDLRDAIRAVADAGGDLAKLGLGTPGSYVTIAGEARPTGQAWGADKAIQVQWEGYATWWDAVAKAKINEVIAQYNQLRTDYNNGTVPTTATAVTPLP